MDDLFTGTLDVPLTIIILTDTIGVIFGMFCSHVACLESCRVVFISPFLLPILALSFVCSYFWVVVCWPFYLTWIFMFKVYRPTRLTTYQQKAWLLTSPCSRRGSWKSMPFTRRLAMTCMPSDQMQGWKHLFLPTFFLLTPRLPQFHRSVLQIMLETCDWGAYIQVDFFCAHAAQACLCLSLCCCSKMTRVLCMCFFSPFNVLFFVEAKSICFLDAALERPQCTDCCFTFFFLDVE